LRPSCSWREQRWRKRRCAQHTLRNARHDPAAAAVDASPQSSAVGSATHVAQPPPTSVTAHMIPACHVSTAHMIPACHVSTVR
jgi:hypothetical protein